MAGSAWGLRTRCRNGGLAAGPAPLPGGIVAASAPRQQHHPAGRSAGSPGPTTTWSRASRPPAEARAPGAEPPRPATDVAGPGASMPRSTRNSSSLEFQKAASAPQSRPRLSPQDRQRQWGTTMTRQSSCRAATMRCSRCRRRWPARPSPSRKCSRVKSVTLPFFEALLPIPSSPCGQAVRGAGGCMCVWPRARAVSGGDR